MKVENWELKFENLLNLKNTRALGRHILLELHDCPKDLLKHPADSEQILLRAAEAMKATVVCSQFHAFSPYGVSGVVIIQESHLTIHTWPEHAYAAVDIFTCGDIDLDSGVTLLKTLFQAKHTAVKQINRGVGLLNEKLKTKN